MYSVRLLILLVIIIFTLTACQSDTESQENPNISPTTAAEVEMPAVGEGSESQSAEVAYPAPEEEPPPPMPEVLYPMVANGDEVGWSQARAMITNGEVERVTQTHELKVTLFLKDGRALITVEPVIDEVMKVIEMCGDKCSDIAVATE